MRRIVYAIITASAAVGVMLPAAASASAPPIKNISSQCHSLPVNSCLGEGLESAVLYLSVPSGAAKKSPVLVEKPNSADTQDFVLTSPGGAPTAIEWAPKGVRSGLCVSEPSTARGTGLQLRTCNGTTYQTWIPTDFTGGGAFNIWKNKASYLAMTDANSGGTGTGQLTSGPLGTAPNEEWEAIA